MIQPTLIYEKNDNGYEFWKEKKTGKILKFRDGAFQQFFDSKGNVVSIDNGSQSVHFRYSDSGKILFEMAKFTSEKGVKEEYKRWYSYDENDIIISIIDSYGNKEFFDADGNPYYSINKRPFNRVILRFQM